MLLPMLVAVLAIGGFIVLRLVLAAHGDISRFAVAGNQWADPRLVPRSLFVFPHSSGYDGQFYWRLAADPTNVHLARHLGVALDVPIRLNRLGYPALGWLLAGGDRAGVPTSLVVVNALALVALARLGVAAARERGLSSFWGLTLLVVPGLVGALSRDLTEVVSTTLVVAGILAMRRRAWLLAALAWTAAVLTRETSAVVVVAFAAVAAYEVVRRRRSPDRTDWAWVVPLVVAAGWQQLMHHVIGTYPLTSSSNCCVGPPVVGLVQSVHGWFAPGGVVQLAKGSILVLQVVAGAVLVVIALSTRAERRRPAEVLALVLTTLVVLLGSRNPWAANLDLRLATDAMAIAWLLLLDAGDLRKLRQALVVNAPVVAITLAARAVVI